MRQKSISQLVEKAEWLWVKNRHKNQYVAFRLGLNLKDYRPVFPVPVSVSAGNLYLLYVNGHYLGRGPVREWPGHAGLDHYDICLLLQPARNVISALVHYFGEDIGGWPLVEPGFFFAGQWQDIALSTGMAFWEAVELAAWKSSSERINLYQGFTENVDLNRWQPAVWEQGQDNPGWQKASVLPAAKKEKVFLERRQIPPLKETLLEPMEIINQGKNFRLYRFSRMVSGRIEMEIRVRKQTRLQLVYGDRLERGKIKVPADRKNTNSSADCLKVPAGRHHWYGTFSLRGYRYVNVTCKPAEVLSLQLRPVEVVYPCVNRAVFQTSDSWLNRCWETARLTVRLCLADTYLDNPTRERQQYGGDGYIQALYAYQLFGDLLLWKQFLRHFAQGQGEDGSCQSGGPWCWNQVIPAWTLLWIESLGEYYRHTREFTSVKEYLPFVEKSFAWFSSLEDRDKLLTVKECFHWEGGKVIWNFIDWQKKDKQLKRETARLALNGFYALALGTAAELFSLAGHKDISSALKRKKETVCCQLRKQYLPEHGLVTATLAGAISGRMGVVAEKISRRNFSTDVLFVFFTVKALIREGYHQQAYFLLQEIFSPMMEKGETTFWETREIDRTSRAICQGVAGAPAYWLPRLVAGLKEIDNLKKELILMRPFPELDYACVLLPCADGEVEVKIRKGKQQKIKVPAGWQITRIDC